MRTSRDGYAQLVRAHQQMLYRHARGMGLDHDTALDIVQDALVRGYTHIGECRDAEHFRAWIGRIGRNLCLDHLKNVRRLSTPLSQLPQAENIGDDRASVDVGVTLYDALDRLPTSLREAFLLKHDAGYSYEEIGEMTDASVSAVKMRVHRARETLRELLDVTISAA
ncbi:MAG TPA: RNA polymerase sigma factor [Longimicrobiales bacterium]|nr:RNA polymerase sigma factor [Longimicrobiales bacterium]